MKLTRFYRNLFLFSILFAVSFFALHAFAQSPTATADPGGSSIVAWLIGFVVGNPKWAAIITLLVAARVPIKLLMTALDSYAKSQLTPHQYATVVHYETRPIFTTFSWILDTLTSVKLPVLNGVLAANAQQPVQTSGFIQTGVNYGEQQATQPPPSGVGVQNTLLAVTVLFVVGTCLSMAVACKSIDPPLPGQTTAAPLVAFTNGPAGDGAYVLGHFVSTNEFQLVVQDAAAVGESLVLKEWPTATNYTADVKLAIGTLTGTANSTTLSNVLAQIPLQSSSDGPLVNSIITTIVYEGHIYIDPLITSDTNSAAYVTAGLNGFVAGWK